MGDMGYGGYIAGYSAGYSGIASGEQLHTIKKNTPERGLSRSGRHERSWLAKYITLTFSKAPRRERVSVWPVSGR